MSRLAPRLAEWQATRIFFTPHRRTRGRPGAIGADAGTPFDVSVGGVRVRCWSYGSGPAVLLVHGWGGSARDWDALAPRLVEAGYRAIVFDGPAHGVSGGRRTNLVEMARTLHAIADEVAMGPDGRFHPLEAVIAHSFGGAAAVLAARDGLQTRDLVLLAPVAEPVSFVAPVADALGLPEARRAGMIDRIRAVAGGDLARIDVVRAIAGSRLPGLVVHDCGDARVPWRQGRAIADAWPRARLVTTSGLGHRGILDSREVAEQVLAHLQRGSAVQPTAARPAPPPRDAAAGRIPSALVQSIRGEPVPG